MQLTDKTVAATQLAAGEVLCKSSIDKRGSAIGVREETTMTVRCLYRRPIQYEDNEQQTHGT